MVRMRGIGMKSIRGGRSRGAKLAQEFEEAPGIAVQVFHAAATGQRRAHLVGNAAREAGVGAAEPAVPVDCAQGQVGAGDSPECGDTHHFLSFQ